MTAKPRPLIVRYDLARIVEGSFSDVLHLTLPPAIQLQDVCAALRNLAFVVEVTSELRDNETAKRCTADARAILAALES